MSDSQGERTFRRFFVGREDGKRRGRSARRPAPTETERQDSGSVGFACDSA